MEVNQENRYDIAPETRLWRYMSFAKFISLLNSKQLLYIPAFRFNDPFEGACGIYQTQADNNAIRQKSDMIGTKDREYTFISCWHENEVESEAMWKLYTQSNPEGVAIQTTYQRLKKETEMYPFIKIGRVSYVNYTKKLSVTDFYLWYKRKSFEHEREVRMMTIPSPVKNIEAFKKIHPNAKITRMVHAVSLENLIENVYISPYAESWFKSLVEEELKKHNLHIKPIQSALNVQPMYEEIVI